VPQTLTAEERELMPTPVVNLFDEYCGINDVNYMEYYHDAQISKDAVLNLFSLGYCTLEHRSLAERLFFAICAKVLYIIRRMDYVPDEFEGLEAMLSDTYFCNYSIFQSMPDSWAIDQLFPIMPIHKLNEEPTCRGILADITLRQRRQGGPVHRPRRVKSVLELQPVRWVGLLHRGLPRRRVPGNPWRSAQPAGRHQRGPRQHR